MGKKSTHEEIIAKLRHVLADETADHVFVIAHRGCRKET